MRRSRLLAAILLPAALLALAPLPAAHAETIRLRSGQAIKVQAVEVLDGHFRVRMLQNGETVHTDLAFERVEPRQLLLVFDRHTDPKDAQRRLQSARIALEVGLADEARKRFKQAAALDEGMLPQSEAGLLAVEKLEAAKALEKLEERLRKGKGKNPAVLIKELEAVLAKLEALLTGPYAGVLGDAQRLRIKVLINHARKRIKREKERLARKAPPPKKPGDTEEEDEDDAERESGNTPGRRTYEDERWRRRRGERPQPPRVPGADRPPVRGGGTGAGPKSGGAAGSSPGGGLPGGGASGGSSGAGRGSSGGLPGGGSGSPIR